MLPKAVVPPLQTPLDRVPAIYQQDLADGSRQVELPHNLA